MRNNPKKEEGLSLAEHLDRLRYSIEHISAATNNMDEMIHDSFDISDGIIIYQLARSMKRIDEIVNGVYESIDYMAELIDEME